MSMLLGVIAGFALLSLVVAVMQAVRMVRLAPAREELGPFMLLGWWKFNRLAAKAGPAAAQHVQIYQRAAIAFLVFIVLGVILSGWAVNQAAMPPAPVTSGLLVNPAGAPADLAFNTHLRRVAMPGAPLVES